MKNVFRFLFFALAIGSVFSLSATANAACVPGKAVVETDSFEEVQEASDEDIAKAKKLATMDAWRRYVKTLDEEHSKAYSKGRSAILKGLAAFIDKVRIADEEFDETEQTLSIEVCITVNTEMFKGALKVEPEIKSGEGSEIVGLFVARQAQTSISFKARVKKDRSGENTEEEDDKSKEKSQSMIKEIARASEGKAVSGTFHKKKRKRRSKRTRRTSSESESGGSTERRSEEIRYKILSAESVNNAMNKALSKAGYELTDYDEIAADCDGPTREEIEESFVSRDALTSRHKLGAQKAAVECEVPFFARGTMTADIAQRHKSGQKVVWVRVRGGVWKYKERKSKKRRSKRRRRGSWIAVVTVEEKQYSGIGINESVARNAALKLAAEGAAAYIAKELRRKGIK